ncbi:LytR/AlgR family response regulator transcription factor [Thalassobellus citreus]|uniref:LytR/AlgR family response regulator transcription factor n=1 Tax=Thalassobellus citreus TaxID=3367752 RepID=UPI0037A17C81
MKKINTLIFEDDKTFSNILITEIRKNFNNIYIEGVATNIQEGKELYKKTKPSILFLDIIIGKEIIFSFLKNIFNDKDNILNTQIIFISSSKEYAYEAIDYNPIGYILKPYSAENIKKNINKALTKINNLDNLNINYNKEVNFSKILAIPYIDKIELIKCEDILYCEADGRYTKFHLINGDTKIASRNLGEYQKTLNNNLFFRIHHSYLVNIYMIHHINKVDGNYCHLINHKTLPIAKRRQEELNRFLNLK